MQASAKITRVRVRQVDGVGAQIAEAIDHSDFLHLDVPDADVIVDVQAQTVNLYTAFGNRITSIAIGDDIVQRVLEALESAHVRRRFAVLENPAAPFAVEMWIDEPGKTRFSTADRVTLFYRVKHLPHGKKAYFTLLNVSPGGVVSILYPQKRDILAELVEQRHLTAEVEPGRVHSIPKNDPLQPGQVGSADLRLKLEQGQEYFKGIVTSQPILWKRLWQSDVDTIFRDSGARGIASVVGDALLTPDVSFFWAAGDLRVEVE